MMPLHLPRRWNAVLIAGCCALLGGCAAVSRRVSAPGTVQLVTELGSSETADAALPPDAKPLGHFLKAEIAMNSGDQPVAMKEYELAVAADPTSALLRQRLAILYVRSNRQIGRAHV